MDTMKALKFGIIFLLGFLSANLISYYFVYGLETPFSENISFIYSNSNNAPSDFITEDQVQVFDDKIVINVQNAELSRYAPTGSMKPILDENSNGIRITPKSEEDIHVGDIITFKQDSYLIIHRVIEKGKDKEGTYFITRGDNNRLSDKKIRFEDIKYKTIGILY
jgi:signal peptidase I